jgi:class 3 adenylate cyclase/tetratricopeptide (TPR) repeat protein
MKCPKCQFENAEGSKFCNECGSKLEIICSACGKINSLISKFCNECGQDLRELIEAPPIDYSKPHSYTPKFLVDKILTTRSSIEGERKLITVLFADVANYTAMSEKLDPEEVHQIMDGCFKILMDEIHKYEGTITQFTGDGVMALFGAPVANEDHAQRACYTALSIQKAVEEYGQEVKSRYGQDFKMRIGLNSGPVVVASIGDDLRMDYTAIGDTTNLASRMESAARPGTILVSDHTHRLARDFFDFGPLGKITVKGKEEPQETYELLKIGKVETRIEAAVAKGLTRFVGRYNSMAALLEAYEKVRSGSGQVVGIMGEAGVGKSRLLLESRNRLPQDEFIYFEGRCIHFGGAMAYLPILDILRSYFEIKEGEQEFLIKKKMAEKIFQLDKNLKAVLPPFQELLSLKVEDEAYLKLEPKQRRERIFEGLRNLFIRESQNRPLVLAIEDLHWIDKTSEEFLDYLIGWLANARILLILLHRAEYTHRWGSKSYFNRIGLDQLSLKSSAELVEAILERGEVAPELKELILNRASGNPLFMEELTYTLLENGSIQRKDNQYVLTQKPSNIQIPDTIQGIIAARMDRLEENLKKIMQVAAVIGREFGFRILQAISGMREELKTYLLNLQSLEFIYEKSLFPELEYIFKHALTQEVAYNSLLLKRRKEIHEKIGKAIEELFANRSEEFYEMLAYHYSRSDSLEKAFQYLRFSAGKATRNNSLWEALRFYKESLGILKQIPETNPIKKERLAVILLMAPILRNLGFPEDPTEILQDGERLCKEIEDKRSMALIYSYTGMYYTFKGNLTLGRSYMEQSLSEAEKASDLNILGPLAYGLFANYILEGNYIRIADNAPRIIRLVEETHRELEDFGLPANLYAALQCQCGFSLMALGKIEMGENLCKKAIFFACEVGHLFSIGVAEMFYGISAAWIGRGEKAVEYLQRSIENFEKSQGTLFLPAMWSKMGLAYYLSGNIPKALEYLEKGLKMQVASGLPFWLSFSHVGLSIVHLELNDLTKALSHAEEAINCARKNKERHWEALSLLQLGMVGWKSQKIKIDEAEQDIRQGIRLVNELGMKPFEMVGYLYLGELFTYANEREKALEILERAEKAFQEMGMDYWLARTQKILSKLQTDQVSSIS